MPVHDTPPPRAPIPPRRPAAPPAPHHAAPTAAQQGVATMFGHHAPTDYTPPPAPRTRGPVFTHEGHDQYAAAHAHNAPFSLPGPYNTRLSPPEEHAFRGWVQRYHIPFNPNAATSDYDMRGYWRSVSGAPHAPGTHFPDTYKTPYDTTFSRESRYATRDNPFDWRGNNLVDLRNGQLVFGTPPVIPPASVNPPGRHAPSDQPGHGAPVGPPPVHGSYEPAPLHGAANAQLQQILARGHGPLALPPGKLNLPQQGHAPLASPPLSLPARGQHRDASPQEIAQALAHIHQVDQQARAAPPWERPVAHNAAVAANIVPLAASVNIGQSLGQELAQTLSHLPNEQSAHILDSLPGVNPGQRHVVDQLAKLTRPGGASGLFNNFISDALHTPQGVFLGGYQTARAVGAAAHGNPKPIEQVGGAAIAPFTSTSNFRHLLYQHPFQALISASGVGRAVGAAAGVAGRAGLLGSAASEALSGQAPRMITETAGARPTTDGLVDITRSHALGAYDRNALVNAFQHLGDRLGENHPRLPVVGANARLGRFGAANSTLARTELDVATRERTLPTARATHGVSKPEQASAIFAQGTRVKPSEWVAHYQTVVNDLEERLRVTAGKKVADKQARSDLQHQIDNARGALRTWQKVFAKTGDTLTPRAQRLALVARRAAHQRETQLVSEGMLDPRQSAARLTQPSEVITGESRPGGFFTHAELARRGASRSPAGRAPSGGRVSSLLPSTGEAFRSGNVDLSTSGFLRTLAEPERLLYAKRQLEEIKRLGTPVQVGDRLGSDQVLVRVKTLVRDANGVFKPNALYGRNVIDVDTVPKGRWIAVNRNAIEPLDRRLSRPEPGLGGRAARATTQAFKWNALLTRPAWLVSNVVGNAAQAALSGVGPVSLYRALNRDGTITRHLPGTDYGGVIPRNVENAGFFARQLAPKRGLLPRSDRLPENPLVRWNVNNENWLRRAVYLRHAIGTPFGRRLGITTNDINALTHAKTAEERAPDVVRVVDRFLGNFAHTNIGDNATIAVPFIRWLGFITKQTLVDLPLHHPARALLLYRLGTLGNIASQQGFGLASPSIEGGIPLPGTHGHGLAGPVSWVLRTGALNPWATVSQLGGFDSTEPTGQPSFSGLFGSLNPFLQAGYSTLQGREFSNPEFKTTRNPNATTRAEFLANQLYDLAPAARLAFGPQQWGEAPRSRFQQPQQPFWMRLLGYNVAGISPMDLRLMNAKNFSTYKKNMGRR